MDRKEGYPALLRPQGGCDCSGAGTPGPVLPPQVHYIQDTCELLVYHTSVYPWCLSFPSSVQNGEHSIAWQGATGAREMWSSMSWVLEVGRKEAFQEESYMWCGTENVLASLCRKDTR